MIFMISDVTIPTLIIVFGLIVTWFVTSYKAISTIDEAREKIEILEKKVMEMEKEMGRRTMENNTLYRRLGLLAATNLKLRKKASGKHPSQN